jgi:hypothetical protein
MTPVAANDNSNVITQTKIPAATWARLMNDCWRLLH